MRFIVTFLFFLPLVLFAQSTVQVQVGGSLIGSTPPFYSPQHVTINVGDVVQWTNTSGTHNVNGTATIFPANPQSFSSGQPASGSWSFQFTFTIPGVYNYHCTQQGHSATQFGSITVINTTSVAEPTAPAAVALYPVPVGPTLTVELGSGLIRSIELLCLDGRTMASVTGAFADRQTIDLSGLAAGQYIARITDAEGLVTAHRFVKD